MSTVQVSGLTKEYTLKAGFVKQLLGKAGIVSAVSGLSLSIEEGEIVGLVGESGCGKSTLGRMLTGIDRPTAGSIFIDERDIAAAKGSGMRAFRRNVQIIFQDPYDSLDPKMTVRDIVAEPLRYLKLERGEAAVDARVREILSQVELIPPEQYMSRQPHRLSGGQRQRVAIARALVVRPGFIVADEPVSMLDVSIRAGILNLLQKLNRETGVGILLITHDLATARFLCSRIIVMYLGKIVEIAPANELVQRPMHPYTQLLLSSAPDLFAERGERVRVEGEAASAVAPPKGCRFSPRCSRADAVCREQEPPLKGEAGGGHCVACHHAQAPDTRHLTNN